MLQFAPDADPTAPGVILSGSGLRPTVRGYANYPAFGQTWTPLHTASFRAYSLYAHQFAAVTGRFLAGGVGAATAAKIYELTYSGVPAQVATDVSGATITAATIAGGTGPEGNPTGIAFASYGEYVIAAHKSLTTLFVQTAKAGSFAAISGSPAAADVCVFANFLIAFNCATYSAATGSSDLVAWSGIGNYSSWGNSSTTQSSFQQLTDVPGRIVCGRPLGDAVAIYKQDAIWLMRYTGNPTVPFSFELVRGVRGILAAPTLPPPVVDIGGEHIFVGTDDIYRFNGQQATSITAGKVREYLRTNYATDSNARSTALTPTTVMHDVWAKEVAFPAYGLTYNYLYNKWGAMDAPPATITVACQTARQQIETANGFMMDASTLVGDSNGYLYIRDALGTGYSAMSMGLGYVGDNVREMTISRVVPKFLQVPTVSGTWTNTLYHTPILGKTVSTVGTATIDSVTYRFNQIRTGNWFRNTIAIPALAGLASIVEIGDVQYVAEPTGMNAENVLQ